MNLIISWLPIIQFRSRNLCSNPFVILVFNRKVFHGKETMYVHMEVWTITAGRPLTYVPIPSYNICDFSVISKGLQRKEDVDTNDY